MGVAVYDKVDAGDLFIEVDGAIAVGCRLGINAQVADADDKVSLLLLQRVNCELSAGIKIIEGREGDFGDQSRIDLGGGLGSLHAEEAELQAACGLNHLCGLINGLTGFIQIDVRTDDGELCRAQILLQLLIAEVKLMVAEGDNVISGGVHHGDGACTKGGADIDSALAEVTGVYHIDLSTGCLKLCLQRRHVGISGQ